MHPVIVAVIVPKAATGHLEFFREFLVFINDPEVPQYISETRRIIPRTYSSALPLTRFPRAFGLVANNLGRITLPIRL